MTRIYQTYFDEPTRRAVSTLALHYGNEWYYGKPLQPAFENHIILDLFDKKAHVGADRFAVLSWAFENKNQVKVSDLYGEHDEDVLTFWDKLNGGRAVWKEAEYFHPGVFRLAQRLLNKMGAGLDLRKVVAQPVYQNAHVTNTEVYQRYVDEWLRPCLAAMFDGSSLAEELNADSSYKHNKLLSLNVRRMTGHPYYTYHTFICERLFSTFLYCNPQYSVKFIEGRR